MSNKYRVICDSFVLNCKAIRKGDVVELDHNQAIKQIRAGNVVLHDEPSQVLTEQTKKASFRKAKISSPSFSSSE